VPEIPGFRLCCVDIILVGTVVMRSLVRNLAIGLFVIALVVMGWIGLVLLAGALFKSLFFAS
jgi:hypothetical protein